MEGTTAGATRPATLEELIDADALRAILGDCLAAQPIDERSVRRGVWEYVCRARDLGTPPGQVILSLTTVVETSSITPISVRDDILRRVILWCVDAYFGQIGERVPYAEHVAGRPQEQRPLPPVCASNR